VSNLFGPPSISRLTPDKSGRWVHIIINRRRVATAPASRTEQLGLAVGAPWTDELAAKVDTAANVFRARLKAIKLLGIRARSSKELQERLQESGFAPQIAQAAIEELKRDKLLDDKALAQDRAAAALASGMSPAAARQRLAKLGIAPQTAAQALTRAGDEDRTLSSEHARAVSAARNRARRLPESLSTTARHRRLLAALARLGYEEDVAQAAVSEVLGRCEET
jgi:regulatory protein